MRVAINGFGRIGRLILRRMLAVESDLQLVAIGVRGPERGDLEHKALLFRYDSNYGPYHGTVVTEPDHLVFDGHAVPIYASSQLSHLPWARDRVDLVIEASGYYTTVESAGGHLHAGAKNVLVTAPVKGPVPTFVVGVNEETYDPKTHHLISAASCTTNCLAPVAKVLNDSFGIRYAHMTTTHAYTNDQRVLDKSHTDPRRARGAFQSIIPTKTGAASALHLVIPELKGKVAGIALRVPVPTVSMVDLVVLLKREVTVEQVNSAFGLAEEGSLNGILGMTYDPIVSVDIKGDERSAIIDAALTQAAGPMVKVMSWYDNEWGYACRVVDLAELVARRNGFAARAVSSNGEGPPVHLLRAQPAPARVAVRRGTPPLGGQDGG